MKKVLNKKLKVSKNNNSNIIIYGKHPLFLALKNKNREFLEIYTSNFNELNKYLKDNNISLPGCIIMKRNNNELDKLIGNVVNHQGYVAHVMPTRIMDIYDFLSRKCSDKNNLPKLLIMDQLTDPHNVGAIIRTAAGFGVNYLIKTKYNSPNDASIIAKSSAGFSEAIEIINVVNINQTIELLKKVGYFVIGLAGEANNDIRNIDNSENICLIVGNEGTGIRPLIKKNCDMLYRINMQNNVESLNVSVATAIAIYSLWGLK